MTSSPSTACCAALDAARALAAADRSEEAAARLADDAGCDACRFQRAYLQGALAARRNDLAAADHWLSAALDADPHAVEALRLHGIVLRRLGRLDAASARYAEVVRLAPGHAEARANYANVLNDLQHWTRALAEADQALALNPALAAAANARGTALGALGRARDAIRAFEDANRLAPDDPGPHVNLGNALSSAGRFDEALANYRRAAALGPHQVSAWNGMGNALAGLERWPEAAVAYDRAYEIEPYHPALLGQRLHAHMKICDWAPYDESRAAIEDQLRQGRGACSPFTLLPISESAAAERRCAEIHVRSVLAGEPPTAPSPAAANRIRVGYFSADLHDHPTAHLMAEVFERHDRGAFEVTAFSYGPRRDDPMRRRLAGAFERFFDVAETDDVAVCDMARGLGLDIAVDLKGFTLGARTGIFRLRPAPVQVSHLGYPGTMGASFIDYLVADPVVVPEAARGDYVERIAYLPWTYQPNDRHRPQPAPATSREAHGLPRDAFVFGCFNSPYKITPEVFAVWMRILRACDGAVLWLYGDNTSAAENLRREAASAGVDPQRLVFARPAARGSHLERLRHMDLFLDTSPYNAHTTASDALWMGTPLITRRGETFAGRVGASLLNAVGEPGLIAESWPAYEDLAAGLFRDRARLAAVRARLGRDPLEKPLFDAPRFTRDLEDLYRRMHERRLAGLPPAHLIPMSR